MQTSICVEAMVEVRYPEFLSPQQGQIPTCLNVRKRFFVFCLTLWQVRQISDVSFCPAFVCSFREQKNLFKTSQPQIQEFLSYNLFLKHRRNSRPLTVCFLNKLSTGVGLPRSLIEHFSSVVKHRKLICSKPWTLFILIKYLSNNHQSL